MRVGNSRALDLSGMGGKGKEQASKPPKPPFWKGIWEDVQDFWQHSYGAIRLYLTPEEASRERLLFGTSLLVVFMTAMGFLAISQTVRLVHIGNAEQARLETLPGTFADILANKRLADLPQIFSTVEDVLDTVDQNVAPGQSSLYTEGSVLYDIGMVRQSVRDLAEAGRAMTPIVTAASTFLQDMQQLDPAALRKKYGSLTEYLKVQWKVMKEDVYPHLQLAKSHLDKVHLEHLPVSVRSKVAQLQAAVNDANRLVEQLDVHMPAIVTLLGGDAPRVYAILLQNSGEMRATGGFIGSLAMVKLNDGWVEYIRFRDVYDVDGQIFEDVPPPPGIETISNAFHLRDANYWPDFPTSAKQVAWFLDKDKGPGVDGVFAISDELIRRLLTVTGPIKFEDSAVPVDADNFMPLLSFLVESKVDKAQPKSALFRFSDAFLPQLAKTIPQAMGPLREAVSDRLILAYAFDDRVQAFLEDAGLSGDMYHPEVPTSSGTVMDYFMPVFTATGGNKSDRYIEQQLTHDSRITDDGKLQDQVTLIRRHTWNDKEEARLRDLVRQAVGQDITDKIMQILGGERNREYMRFFVPKGAVLTAVEGIDRAKVKVMEDLGYTVFGFEMSTQLSQQSRVRLTYTLPTAVQSGKDLSYFLVMQKQPGGANLAVTKTMTPTSRAVIMADTAGYSVVADNSQDLALDIRPQEISLHNIWHGGYLLRVQ